MQLASPPSRSDASDPPKLNARLAALHARVNAAALDLDARGIRPTVMRIRAALGGGSPNELAPALKAWKEAIFLNSAAPASGQPAASRTRLPAPIADLAGELWQRATAAARIEQDGGPQARQRASRSGEVEALRAQIASLREQYEREALAYGELRAHAARQEAIAREALADAREAQTRERNLLRRLGKALQQAAQMQARIEELLRRLAKSTGLGSRSPMKSASAPARPSARRAPSRGPHKQPTRRTAAKPVRKTRKRKRRAMASHASLSGN
jgi:hypothetical protein